MATERKVRILLVGDSQAGKTSLILALVSEQFPDRVPARAEEITIPADVTPERVPTSIVDYSSRQQTKEMLKEEIGRANVVCIVYDVTSEESRQRLSSHWLPFVSHETGGKKPIILVGNKDDLQDGSSFGSVLDLMETYREVETCVECSARSLRNVSEMFYFAQKAVLHPAAPLYASDTEELTEKCLSALMRVFSICDEDKDDLLTNIEINRFQKACFCSELERNELDHLKAVIEENCPKGLTNGGINCMGFIHLHKVFIQRGRHETTWTVLRKFGYDDDLSLNQDFLNPDFPGKGLPGAELSATGYQFLTQVFEACDQDKDGALSVEEAAALLRPLGSGAPWDEEASACVAIECTEEGNLTLDGFLGYWCVKAAIDLPELFGFCASLGFNFKMQCASVTKAIKMTEVKYTPTRKTFHCLVHSQSESLISQFLHRIGMRRVASVEASSVIKYSAFCKKESNQSIILYNAQKIPERPLHVDVSLILMESCQEDDLEAAQEIIMKVGSPFLLAHVSPLAPDSTPVQHKRLDLPQSRYVNLHLPGRLPVLDELMAIAQNPNTSSSDFGGVLLKMMLSFAVGLAAVFITQKFFRRK